ncbi:hypothetical protein [Flavobacterium agrisoli]|uniref:Uncharacterized protein n=1 Tax=Flavobacterium agrisoli TaxID=2793066 RepID=A0A934UJ94_9FLAO|nr:hypothetical protein [Flavobacterium agrisoli]MBK0369721.1 hypothetical protein [Flavobacterium agrisoli]
MKKTQKIAILFICLVLALPWAGTTMLSVLKTTTEKSSIEKKEALPESESDTEDKTFELVYDFLPSFSAHFQVNLASVVPFFKVHTLAKSIPMDLSNPPPEFKLVA